MHDTIFLNKEAVMPGFKLDNFSQFLCREKEVDHTLFYFKKMFRECPIENLLIITQGGTGVSTLLDLCVRFAEQVSKQLNQKLCVITVDCEKYNTDFSILNYVRNSLPYEGKKPKALRGSCYYSQAIKEFICNYDGRVIIILEDAGKIKGDDYAIEMFVRMVETDHFLDPDPCKVRNHPFLICVTKNLRFGSDFNSSLDSRYHPWTTVMTNYDGDEIREILTERVKVAFKPDVISPEVLDLLVTANNEFARDMPLAMDFLLHAGEIADERGQNKITIDIMQELIHKHYYQEDPSSLGEEIY